MINLAEGGDREEDRGDLADVESEGLDVGDDPISEVGGEVVDRTEDLLSLQNRDLLQDIRSSAYYGVGLDPKVSSLHERSYRLYALEECMNSFVESGEPIHFLVADDSFVYNLLPKIKKKEAAKPEGERKSDEEVMAEARETARLMGLRERLLLESIAEVKFGLLPYKKREERGGRNVKIEQLSDLLEGNVEFERLHAVLERNVRAAVDGRGGEIDQGLVEMLWATVPEGLRKRALNKHQYKKSVAELDERWREPAFDLMRYPLHEVATVLYLNCARKGPMKEDQYGKIVDYVYENYGERLELSENNMSLECLSFSNTVQIDYAAVGSKGAVERDDTVGLLRNLPESCSVSEDKEIYDFFLNSLAVWQAFVVKLRSLRGRMAGQEQVEKLMQVELKKLVDDFVKTWSNYPFGRWLFQSAGLKLPEGLDEEIDIEGLRERDRTIPFDCPREGGESDLAYYAKFVAYLISGIRGPASMFPGSEMNRFGYEIYELLKEIYYSLEDRCFKCHGVDASFYEDKWQIPFGDWCYVEFGEMPMYVDWTKKAREQR